MYTSCREFDQFIASFTPVCMDCFQMLMQRNAGFTKRLLLKDKAVPAISEWESEWALLAGYVYTFEEFVKVTEAPQCNRMTETGQDTENKRTIYKYKKWQKHNIQYRQLCVYRSDMCKFEMKRISMCGE